MKKKTLIITILTATAALAFILIITNQRSVNAYGIIKQAGNGFVLETEVIDCELKSETFIILNAGVVTNYINKSIQVNGLALMNYLNIALVNESFNLKRDCYAVHEEDVKPAPLNYQVSAGNPEIIKYNITNNQDQRLFYECRLTTDCNLTRDYFTGYLDPGEYHEAYFNVTCSQGVHNSTVKTVFVDELVNYHTVINEIVITAS